VGPVWAILHALAAGAWFGSLYFSYAFLYPRAARFFESSRRFEEFVATINFRQRYWIIAGFTLIALSGIGLAAAPTLVLSPAARSLLIAKAGLFVASFALFGYTSWVLWPRRLFAGSADLARIQRQFRTIGITQLTLATLMMALGVLLHWYGRTN